MCQWLSWPEHVHGKWIGVSRVASCGTSTILPAAMSVLSQPAMCLEGSVGVVLRNGGSQSQSSE